MIDTLNDNLQTIYNELMTKLIPENLRSGVNLLNVTGTLEPNASIVEGAKLFKTKEEMNSSTGNTEGDLALVYKNEQQNTFDGIYIYKNNNWELAPTQLTATPGDVYKQLFYGKNGLESGTLGTPDNSFADTNAELYNKIQNQYENMEPRILTDDDKTINKNIYFIPVKKDGTPLLDTGKVTNMDYMFNGCKNLATIPKLDTSNATDMANMFNDCTKLTTIPELNTSNVTDMFQMFAGCSSLTAIPELNTSSVTDMSDMFGNCRNLTTIPELNTSKVTNMSSMFEGCSSLSDDSLNIIMQMCINATSYTYIKTLKETGLTSEQADKCKTLSNYSAFTSAGWTTGY